MTDENDVHLAFNDGLIQGLREALAKEQARVDFFLNQVTRPVVVDQPRPAHRIVDPA